MYILILIFAIGLNSIILLLLILLHLKNILNFFHTICKLSKEFILIHNGFFTILFDLIFLTQQLLLIIVSFIFEVPRLLSLFIGLFALIVIATASSQKFIWQFKFTIAHEIVQKNSHANSERLRFTKELIDDNIKLKENLEKIKKRR